MQKLRLDLLGAVRYPRRAIRGAKKGGAVAVLDRVFHLKIKPHNSLYSLILRSKKNLTLVVHGSWAGASHIYTPSHIKLVKRLASRLWKIADDLGATNRIWLSPFLERRNDTPAIRDCYSYLMDSYPNLKLINSILPGGGVIMGTIPEVHGSMGNMFGPYIWSSDGLEVNQQDVDMYKMKHQNAEMFGLWHHNFNGKATLHDNTSPSKRTNWPTVKQIRQLARMY